MNRWVFAGLVGALGVMTGCGDDSSTSGAGGSGGQGGSSPTTTTTGQGGGGGEAGGGGPGGGGTGGNLEGCGGPGECPADQRCEFRDGLCGAGDRGTCVPRADVCSDGEAVCLCDGSVVEGTYDCEDTDADATGSCDLLADSFACAEKVCLVGGGAYCQITGDDTGGAPYASCATTEEPTCGENPTCACLTAEIEACSGTCEDGDGGATIVCPGG